jgi:uncharacterized damage-inducible protein DinB
MNNEGMARLLEYTKWANHKVVRAAATLGVDDFRKDLGSSHGGVRGTLAHMLSAEWIWLERWKGVSPTKFLDEGEYADIVALSERWKAVERHRDSWLKGLGKGAARQKIRYKSMAGQPFEEPLWQLVQHVANHSSYHRGQVMCLLRQLGAKGVTTDLVFWDRERAAKARLKRS